MAEPPVAAPAGVAAPGPDVLLATKLHVPRSQRGFVPRPHLAEALDEGLARRLILVCAPAGFGKTALLADWTRRGKRPVAWLSLEAADNDPARFWRYAVAALDRARPGIAERAGPLLGPPAPPSFEGLVTALINELAAWPGEDEMVLVLDDYHLIDAQPVHGSLEFLLEHLPPGLHLVLASRSDPPLPLPRLRAGGQLAELRAADLRFTAEEAAALLRESAGADLPAAAVAALAARTEGWVAGLQLAALSLGEQADPAGFVAAFSGSHRYVLDYLAEEVLDRQHEELRTFLLETSLLERLSGGLCDAVTGRTDSQAMLERVERAGLFLVPLDEVRGWWRYHHLFADLLRARLQQQQPGRVAGLHRAAAAWCEEHGLADDAVRHALAAGDTAWAARLVERYADAFLLRSEDATLQRWLAALPAGLAGSRPRLLLAQARLALLSHRVEAAEVALDAAERALASAPGVADEPFEPSVGRAASLFANIPAAIALEHTFLAVLHGDAEHAIVFASQALANLGDGEWLLTSHVGGYLGVAEWLRGQLAEAERALSSSIGQWRAAGQPTMTARGSYRLGKVQRAQGRLDTAAGTYRQALDITAPPGRPALPAAGIAYVGLAEVAYEQNELEAALRHVSEGIGACRQMNFTHPLATGLATLAWIRQAQGDAAGAREAMEEAGQAAPARAWPACSTRSRRSGPGCSWPRATLPRPPAGPRNAASARTTSRVTHGSRSTWSWPGCCSPRTAPARRSRCCSGCTWRPSAKTGRAASSRSRRCRRSRWRPQTRRPPRWTPWPGRSPWPARRVISGCSPTRARRWPRCWAACSRPSAQSRPRTAASNSAAWPGCCGRSAARMPWRALGEAPPRRCRAWWSS